MEKNDIKARRIVMIVFVALMALTVGVAAYAIVYDLMMVERGMYERTGLEELFYFAVVAMAIYSLVAEINLWFDVSYYVSDKSKKRKYKTVFHIVGTSLVAGFTAGAVTLIIVYVHVISVLTGVFAIALGVTRLAHFIVYLIALIKEDKKISKEIDTQ